MNNKQILDNVPEGVTHFAVHKTGALYLKRNKKTQFCYHDGRTYCSFKSKSNFLNTCERIRSLDDIREIESLREQLKTARADGVREVTEIAKAKLFAKFTGEHANDIVESTCDWIAGYVNQQAKG